MNIKKIINLGPFSFNHKDKSNIVKNKIKKLTLHHYHKCEKYKIIIKNLKINLNKLSSLEDFPMIPARSFKNFDLMSVPKHKVVKKLTSSGTSGKLSKIYLDKENVKNQTRVLENITSKILGKKRMPMLIIDQKPNLSDRSTFNARSAAIYGFSIFGKNHIFLLNKKNNIDYKILNSFLNKYGHDNFFIFGFTSLVYQNLFKKLKTKHIHSNFKNGILLHGGGWKKMEKIGVSNNIFKQRLFKKIKLKNVYNYYGLVEQTGSIFIECKVSGNFVPSVFSDVLIRDKKLNLAKKGEKGLVQLLSLLPTSYPGHNILTEDIGKIVSEGNCKCGLQGKHFKLYGRAKEAEVRGCSDVG